MLFSSLEFLLWFLPIFFILYALTPKRFKNAALLTGSLIFYAMGEERYLWLMIVSVLVNYFVGIFLGKKNRYKSRLDWRKVVLFFAITGNVIVLFVFKVTLGGDEMPLGVSFYTFQILSYLIDIYRGTIPAEHSLVKTATYVTMFPQLISGPIVNYGEVAAEMSARRMTWKSVQDGLKVFTLGLIAKVLVADRVGLLWNDVQVRGFESISTPLAWLGAVAYSFKIYFDFYGYSLMAVGLGTMIGFRLPENFREPYMAASVRDFYRRWHITLGRWFCSYVYIPLGGNRRGELCTVRNLLIVWTLTGLWHGISGNFLIWGVLLWVLIVLERQINGFWNRHPIGGRNLWKPLHILPHLYLWAVIPVTWMCFAITDIRQLAVYLGRMFGQIPQSAVMPNDWVTALQNYGVLLAFALVASTPLIKRLYHKWKESMAVNVILAALFWLCVWRIMEEGNNPFLYFRF